MVETSTYFQSITSWVDGDTAYAGVKKEKRYSGKDGTEYVTDIAYLHEFGSETRGVPARPLWKPTFKEAMAWHWKNNKPEEIFLNIVKKY